MKYEMNMQSCERGMKDGAIKLNKALKILNERGLNGLIIYSDGPCVMAHPSYLYYFSGLKPLGPNNAMIVSKSGNVVLFVEPQWDLIWASRKSWVSDVRSSSDFIKDLKIGRASCRERV